MKRLIGLAALTLCTLLMHTLPAAAQFSPLRSWGANESGQLGNGTFYSLYNSPQMVNCPSGVYAIAAGGQHTMMIRNDGTVWTWGNNALGQLGYTAPFVSNRAQQTVGLDSVRAIAAGGDASFAVRYTDNTVWAWGGNSSGQLGIGTQDNTAHQTPVQVQLNIVTYPALGNISQVSAGSNHCLALSWSGNVFAWGSNFLGQLGDGTTVDRSRAVGVPITNVIQVAAGPYHSLALKSDGTVWTWGENDNGQLGDGTYTNRGLPVQVNGLNNVVAIAGSANCSAALKSDGTVWVWGFFYGTTNSGALPTRIDGLVNIQNIALGQAHILATDNHDDLYVYGNNLQGQCGNPAFGTYVYPARKLESIIHVNALTAGADFSIVRTYSANIGGAFTLQGVVPSPYYQTVSFTFYSVGNLPFTRNVNVYNGNSNYQVNDLPRRNYTVRVKGDKWLARQFSLDLTNGDASFLDMTLLAGDANNDNVADIGDLLLLIAHYNKTQGNAGFLNAADFNCDDTNDIGDLLLLIANYNRQGE